MTPATKGVLRQISRSGGGLPKLAVTGPVMLEPEGIDGDRHRNLKYHGGPDKAVLMIAAELVDRLAGTFPVSYGALGENLTVSGMDPHGWRQGQRYRVGECKAGDVSSPHWAHGGFYARVIRPGLVIAGARVELESDVA